MMTLLTVLLVSNFVGLLGVIGCLLWQARERRQAVKKFADELVPLVAFVEAVAATESMPVAVRALAHDTLNRTKFLRPRRFDFQKSAGRELVH